MLYIHILIWIFSLAHQITIFVEIPIPAAVVKFRSCSWNICLPLQKISQVMLQRTFGLCQLATSLKKGCGSETNNILTMLISETYYIGTLTSQHASRGLLNYLRSGARVTRVLCSVLARLKPFRRRVRGDAFLRHSSSSCTQAGNGL